MKRRNFIGILFIALALLMVLNTFNFFPGGIIFVAISTVLLGYIAIRGLLDFDSFGTIFPLALLFYIYNRHFHFVDISSGKIFIIALLLAIGVSMLVPKKLKYNRYTKVFNDTTHSDVTFGENVRYININDSDYFTSKTTFGETNIYFEKLDTYPLKDVELNISATFGEVKIFIPKEWSVENKVTTIFGEVNTPFFNEGRRDVRIVLTGSLTFGEIKIIHI